MRVRSNSKHSSTSMHMEVEKPKLKEETRLSGADIRSLVKQLSSSRPKDPSNSAKAEDGSSQVEYHGEFVQIKQRQETALQTSQARQAPPRKKQVRRRLPTSKPYQERLLNMAEARREIVTALKFHRASMKQAKEQQQQQQQHHQSHNSQVVFFADSTVDRPLITSTFPSYINSTLFSPLSHSSPFSYNQSPSTTAPPLSDLPDQNFNIPFPNQPLGLNLNLQGFQEIEACFRAKPPMESLPSPSSSSASYSNSSPIFTTTTSGMDHVGLPSISSNPVQASGVALEYTSSTSMHPVMDDTDMAEIRNIGEQHEMEWGDTVNLLSSAWWSKFLKDTENYNKDDKDVGGHADELSKSNVFGEVFDMQSCSSDHVGGRDGIEGSYFQQQLDSSYHASEYQQDDAYLACLDFGEIDGWEWLS